MKHHSLSSGVELENLSYVSGELSTSISEVSSLVNDYIHESLSYVSGQLSAEIEKLAEDTLYLSAITNSISSTVKTINTNVKNVSSKVNSKTTSLLNAMSGDIMAVLNALSNYDDTTLNLKLDSLSSSMSSISGHVLSLRNYDDTDIKNLVMEVSGLVNREVSSYLSSMSGELVKELESKVFNDTFYFTRPVSSLNYVTFINDNTNDFSNLASNGIVVAALEPCWVVIENTTPQKAVSGNLNVRDMFQYPNITPNLYEPREQLKTIDENWNLEPMIIKYRPGFIENVLDFGNVVTKGSGSSMTSGLYRPELFIGLRNGTDSSNDAGAYWDFVDIVKLPCIAQNETKSYYFDPSDGCEEGEHWLMMINGKADDINRTLRKHKSHFS